MEIARRNRYRDGDFWSINHTTLPYKIHFFLFLGAISAVLPFMAVLAKTKFQLSGAELAIIFATQQFITVLTKPLIGAVVDRFNKMKLVMVTLITLKALFVFLLLSVPGSGDLPHSDIILKDTKLSSSFNLNCDTSDTLNISCHLKESICRSLSSPILTTTNKTDIQSNDSHWTHLCHNENFTCCDIEKEFVPHSFRQDTIQCTKHSYTNQTIQSYASQKHCIPFFVTESGTKSIKAHTRRKSTEMDPLVKNPQSSALLCFEKIDKDSLIQSTSESNEFDINLKFSEDQNLYHCTRTESNDSSCGALGNILLVDLCASNEHYVNTPNICDAAKVHHSPYHVWIFAVTMICMSICVSSLFTISDTACHETLQKSGEDYGRQRLWGSIGWGLISPLAGALNDLATRTYGVPDFSPGFYVFGVLVLLQILNMMRLDLAKPNLRVSVFKQIGKLFKSPRFVLFDFGVLMTGFFTGVIWFYLLIFLESIGSNKLLMGLVQTTQCLIGELPLMYFSGWIIKKIGHMNTLVITFLCFATRFAWYHSLYNPWFVLPVEITHGVCFGVFYSAMTSFAKSSASEGMEATTQAVLGSTYSGLGCGLGSVVTGICFDRFGMRTTFLSLSCLSLFAATVQLAGSYCLIRFGKSAPKSKQIEHNNLT